MNPVSRLFGTERNKTLFLLCIMIVHNLIYPMSSGSGIQPILFYLLFNSMFVIAVFLLSDRRKEYLLITVSGAVVFVSGVVNAYQPGTPALPILYISAIAYHLIMIVVLVRYIFAAKWVFSAVILAAASLYLIIGSMFTAIYGLIEWLEPGSFAIASGAALGWQHFIYYSYVTLTSLGYGDITPVKYYAQSFSTFEAVIGILYTVIILSRLVALHEVDEVEKKARVQETEDQI